MHRQDMVKWYHLWPGTMRCKFDSYYPDHEQVRFYDLSERKKARATSVLNLSAGWQMFELWLS